MKSAGARNGERWYFQTSNGTLKRVVLQDTRGGTTVVAEEDPGKDSSIFWFLRQEDLVLIILLGRTEMVELGDKSFVQKCRTAKTM